ncbi:MAG: hypothetical protein ABMA64_30615 [Myxococcota bacterium]
MAQEEHVSGCEDERESAEVVAADPRWVLGADGRFAPHATVDPSYVFVVSVEASFGGASAGWVQGPVKPDSAGLLVLSIAAPAEAWLDAAAGDYLTGMRVRLVGTGPLGTLTLYAPPSFLAWPAGLAGGEVVWDQATAERVAPNGVVSPAVQATLTGLPAGAWVQPASGRTTRTTE